jgi:hypothetical protein
LLLAASRSPLGASRQPHVFEALQRAEARLARRINPTVSTPADWRKKREEANGFVVKVAAQPKVLLIGTEDDLD